MLGQLEKMEAAWAGLSERTLRNLEGGRSQRPYPDTIRRLADERGRLSELSAGDLEVRASLS